MSQIFRLSSILRPGGYSSGGLRHYQFCLTLSSIPIYELWYQATQSRTIATIFILIIAFLWLFTLLAVQQTASRLTWSFARDDALIWSSQLGKINEADQLPIWATMFNFACTFILGCVYFASSNGRLPAPFNHSTNNV